MQAHFDLMQFRAETVDLAAQTPTIEPVAIPVIYTIHLSGNPFDFMAEPPIATITA
ncbi:MAG: hypothetical protein QOE81_924 [Verrucomicrobiota bacterium]